MIRALVIALLLSGCVKAPDSWETKAQCGDPATYGEWKWFVQDDWFFAGWGEEVCGVQCWKARRACAASKPAPGAPS
jgi:hypothetical protein